MCLTSSRLSKSLWTPGIGIQNHLFGQLPWIRSWRNCNGAGKPSKTSSRDAPCRVHEKGGKNNSSRLGDTTLEAHNFQRDLAQYEKRNAAIVGVSVDSADSHQQFCTKEGLKFKLLADTGKKVSEQYGSLTNMGLVKFATRHTFLIDPNGKIARVYTRVDPAQHSTDVLSALDDLQKSSPAGTN